MHRPTAKQLWAIAALIVLPVDELYGELVSKGVTLTQKLSDKPWGMREFGVRTPDGHRIMLGQEM